METITLVIVDDHPLFRQGVANALAVESDITIVGLAATAEQGLELIRKNRPRVAVVDINLPGMNGHQLIRQVTLEKLPTRVVLLTAYDDKAQQLHSWRVGAAGYCTKDVRPEVLVQVVRQVDRGHTIYVGQGQRMNPQEIQNWMDQHEEDALQANGGSHQSFQPLSDREMEVLVLLANGQSNKEIAALLEISHQTVKNHVTSILRKLNVDDRTQATLFALRQGWVRLNQETIHPQE